MVERQRRLIALTLLGLSGCMTVPVVKQAADEKPLQELNLSCSSPHELTQDCGPSAGVRVLTIEGIDVAVSATRDGSTVVILDAHPAKHIFLSNPLLMNSPRHSKAANAAYEVVSDALDKGGFKIIRAIPLKTLADTSGYILHLDGNGYEALKAYTVRLRGAATK
jgi:hypothetical protein